MANNNNNNNIMTVIIMIIITFSDVLKAVIPKFFSNGNGQAHPHTREHLRTHTHKLF